MLQTRVAGDGACVSVTHLSSASVPSLRSTPHMPLSATSCVPSLRGEEQPRGCKAGAGTERSPVFLVRSQLPDRPPMWDEGRLDPVPPARSPRPPQGSSVALAEVDFPWISKWPFQSGLLSAGHPGLAAPKLHLPSGRCSEQRAHTHSRAPRREASCLVCVTRQCLVGAAKLSGIESRVLHPAPTLPAARQRWGVVLCTAHSLPACALLAGVRGVPARSRFLVNPQAASLWL